MNTEIYEYATNKDNLVYMFYSSGKKGVITKIIIYEKIANNHYNLAFGDYDTVQKSLNDLSVTNNGDTIKVLGTVIDTIQKFFTTYLGHNFIKDCISSYKSSRLFIDFI